MAELPVIVAAINFVTAIKPFPARAAITTLREPWDEDIKIKNEQK